MWFFCHFIVLQVKCVKEKPQIEISYKFVLHTERDGLYIKDLV